MNDECPLEKNDSAQQCAEQSGPSSTQPTGTGRTGPAPCRRRRGGDAQRQEHDATVGSEDNDQPTETRDGKTRMHAMTSTFKIATQMGIACAAGHPARALTRHSRSRTPIGEFVRMRPSRPAGQADRTTQLLASSRDRTHPSLRMSPGRCNCSSSLAKRYSRSSIRCFIAWMSPSISLA